MLSGHLVTGILHIINKCPIDWYSNKQGTVKMVTFVSEANAARTAMEQIIDLRGSLRYMGVPLRDSSYMFGDNKTVIDSGSLPHAKLHKRHTMLSYHHVREAIASGMVKFFQSLVKLTQLTFLVSIGDTSRSGSNSNHSCSGREICRSCSKRSTAK